MKKTLILLLTCFLMTAWNARAEDAATMQALKSFSAWSIVHYKEYDGDWEKMWDGWLNDPVVPANIKEKGLQDKAEIQQGWASLKDRISSFGDQTAQAGRQAVESGQSWLDRLKESTKEEIDQALSNAIKGE